MQLTAEVFFMKYGPAVRVFEPGCPSPWEFSLRHRPRTPLQRRACELRAIAFVKSKIEERDRRAA